MRCVYEERIVFHERVTLEVVEETLTKILRIIVRTAVLLVVVVGFDQRFQNLAYTLGQVDKDDTLVSRLQIRQVSPLRMVFPRVSRWPSDEFAVSAFNFALSGSDSGLVPQQVYDTVRDLHRAMGVKSLQPVVR